jgi:hypothetical protein
MEITIPTSTQTVTVVDNQVPTIATLTAINVSADSEFVPMPVLNRSKRFR